MVDDQLHIGIIDSNFHLAGVVDEFQAAVETQNLCIQRTHSDEPQVMMTLGDWLPTIVAIWISKKYFSAFLKQSGQDHSKILTQALVDLSRKMFHREKDAVIVRAGGKTAQAELYSILYSILTVAHRCTIKFVFNTKHSEQAYVANSKAVLKFLEAFHSDNLSTKYTPIVDAIYKNEQIVVAYNSDSDSLYLV